MISIMQGKNKRYTIAAIAVNAAALAVCVFLCTRVRTGNAARLELWVIGIALAALWTGICLVSRFAMRDLRRKPWWRLKHPFDSGTFGSRLRQYLLLGMLTAFFWAWIFTLLTDTSPSKKVVLFAEVSACRDTALSEELEAALPDGVRMVQAHPFSYAMFNDEELNAADLYVIPESSFPKYRESLLPIPDAFTKVRADLVYLNADGKAWGILARAAGTPGAASSFLTYASPDAPEEDFYLFFSRTSLHARSIGCGADDAAAAVADLFLTLS